MPDDDDILKCFLLYLSWWIDQTIHYVSLFHRYSDLDDANPRFLNLHLT